MSDTQNLDLSEVTVLLVEDNDDDAVLLRRELKRSSGDAFVDDIEIDRAKSLNSATELCANQSFDAVFLDLGLPDSNGTETVVRFTDHGFDVPVIVLTGLRDSKTALEAIQSGAQDYLVKGEVTAKTVLRTMRHAIERKKNEQKLRRQRDQMEFFNSILRHDMLNGMEVIGARAALLSEELTDQEFAGHAETIEQWSDEIIDLTRKVRDTLDTITNDEGPELRPINVADIVADLTEGVEGMRDGVSVSTDGLADVHVRADDLLADVLRNLLTNAVEHTKPDPVTINVSATRHGNTVELVVADNGPGIPEESKADIFKRGESGTGSSGTGFGLYFVDVMVESYGGEITVENTDPHGATFVLELVAA
jgi:signal transduction histidine kinase